MRGYALFRVAGRRMTIRRPPVGESAMSLGLILVIILIIFLLGGFSGRCCLASYRPFKPLKLQDIFRTTGRDARIHYQARQESHFCQTSLYWGLS